MDRFATVTKDDIMQAIQSRIPKKLCRQQNGYIVLGIHGAK